MIGIHASAMARHNAGSVRTIVLFLLVILVAGAAGIAHYAVSGHAVSGIPNQAANALGQGRAFVEQHILADRTPSAPGTNPAGTSEAIEAYFAPCQSINPFGIDDALIRLIGGAKHSVYAAFYELELQPVADALIAKHREGVDVRIVSDSDYQRRDAVRTCIQAGIPVVFDGRQPFMHNKFCVVDNRVIWTGSTNTTENCMYRNDNNSVRIASDRLAANYTAEFEEMFGDHRFGKGKRTACTEVTVEGTRIENYFAPEDDIQDAIVRGIGDSKAEIDVLAFSFTSEPIAKAIATRVRDGIRVRAVFDKTQAGNAYSQDDFMREHGVDVRLDGNEYAMHDKVIVIDTDAVITGSYNFTKAAETKNDENILIIHSPSLASQYRGEFERIYAAGTP